MMGVMERELKARRRERVNKQDVRVVASDGERHKWQTRKTNNTRSGTMNETHARPFMFFRLLCTDNMPRAVSYGMVPCYVL